VARNFWKTPYVIVSQVIGVNIDFGNDYTLAVKGAYVFGAEFLNAEEKHGTLSVSLIYQLGGDRTFLR